MKNQEYMANLTPDDFYSVMKWLTNEYGKEYRDGGCYAVCLWLNMEAQVGMWRVADVVSDTDALYVCSHCGTNDHVYGIDHPRRHPVCKKCGTFNMYS